MDIGKNIQRGFDLYTKNFVTLFSACLVTGILAAVTAGILAGPLIGGVMILGLKLSRGEKGEFGEIFNHFDQFIPTLIVTLILLVTSLILRALIFIPVLGLIVNLLVGPGLGLVYFLAIGFIVDRRMEPAEALKRSLDYFLAAPAPLWIYSLVTGIMAGIGAIIFIIGVFLTAPFGAAAMTIVYQEVSTNENTPSGMGFFEK